MDASMEARRVAALRHYEILDTPRESTFDRITQLLADMLGVPLACISLVDDDRVWFKSAVGLEVPEVEREDGFCTTLVSNDEIVRHIQDAARHPETSNHSLVSSGGIRFYAGAPLCTEEGLRIGTLCAFGTEARPLTATETETIRGLAELVMNEIELRRTRRELERTETTLRRSQRLESIGMVASGVAHDFNNLLCGVLGHAELLQAHVSRDEEARELLASILDAGERAADLAGQVLAYVGQEPDLPSGPVHLNRLIRETRRLLAGSPESKLPIDLDLLKGLPPVHGQSTGLRQLVLNLIKNAAEACEGMDGRITVRTSGPSIGDRTDSVVLEVEDTGRGLTPEQKERIFDPFFTSKPGGRGLGLAICRRILDQHDATVEVDSEPGRGTTFRITLPVAMSSSDSAAPEAEEVEPAAGSRRILIVDDEEMIRKLAGRALRSAGYAVTHADGGERALELLSDRRHGFDAVLLDWSMPDVDGAQVLQTIRARGLDVPVILSSGHSEQTARESTRGHGIRSFLKKPYRVAALLEAISDAVPEGGGADDGGPGKDRPADA